MLGGVTSRGSSACRELKIIRFSNYQIMNGDIDWFDVIWFGLPAVYFIPGIVAVLRRKRDWLAICVLNLLAGWTVLGWVVAMVWAVMKDRPDWGERLRSQPPPPVIDRQGF